MDLQREIERILRVQGLRSADRANLNRLLVQIRKGGKLGVQERENLWAYRTRYLADNGSG